MLRAMGVTVISDRPGRRKCPPEPRVAANPLPESAAHDPCYCARTTAGPVSKSDEYTGEVEHSKIFSCHK